MHPHPDSTAGRPRSTGGQPRLLEALREDARVACALRGERYEFRSAADAIAQGLRLAFVSDAYLGQALYRVAATLRARRVPVLPRVLHRLAIASAAIYIGNEARLQPGVYVVHGQVVVQGNVWIGHGAVLAPAVTVAAEAGQRVVIGPGASLGTGCRVLGDVEVGPKAQVGANSVVLADVPAGSTAVGIPASVSGEAAS